MAITDYYLNFLASVQKFCNQSCQDVILEGFSADAEIFDFDGFAEVESFPEKDLIGTAEYALEKDNGTYVVSILIGVSTYNDNNLIRMNKIVNRIYQKLDQGTARINIVDHEDGTPAGLFTVRNGLSVMPVARTKNRPFKFIAVQLGTDRATP